MSVIPTSILETIGNTPLIQLTKLDTGCCSLFVKLENQNPGGSIKDRVALSMIDAAEREGLLKPGGTIVEATAGNTGLGLALVASQKGYKLVLVIPDKMSREKLFHLRAMGAEIVNTRSDVGKGHPEYYQDYAERIAKETGGFYVNQFCNAANPIAHETTTGPEIWEQMDHQLDAIVCGVGSGGTMTGLSRYFERVDPHVEMVLADPQGSILVDYIKTNVVRTDAGSWLVEGIGEDFIPTIADLSRVKSGYSVSDSESFHAARELLLKEGILGGSSAGTLIAAALRYCKDQTTPKRVVTFICDSGNKYLSKMFNDYWMIDHGFITRPKVGDLRDLISRRHEERATITVGPEDTVATSMHRMKIYDISQLPVVEGEKIVGMVDEYDLLRTVGLGVAALKKSIKEVMTQRLITVSPSASIAELMPIFERGEVVIVEDGGRFLGLITKMDVINYLRQQIA